MLKATFPINRYNIDCVAKLRPRGLCLSFHNDNENNGNDWYSITVHGEAYLAIKPNLASLIYDKAGSFGEIKKVTLRKVSSTNHGNELALVIVPKTKFKDWFTLTIEDENNIYLTFDMRRTELISIMDSATEFFVD